MGIDYTKELEVWHVGEINSGEHLYNGWLHVIGNMKGLDVFEKPSNISGDLTAISDTFNSPFAHFQNSKFYKFSIA